MEINHSKLGNNSIHLSGKYTDLFKAYHSDINVFFIMPLLIIIGVLSEVIGQRLRRKVAEGHVCQRQGLWVYREGDIADIRPGGGGGDITDIRG